MSLDDFLEECRRKGATALRYCRKARDIYGNEYSESFESRVAAGLRPRIPHGQQERSHNRIDDVVSGLYGQEVVIRTNRGYHYGELLKYGEGMFWLKGYCFSRKPMDTFEYGAESIFSEDAVVPARDIISVAKIPIVVDEAEEAEHVFSM